MQYKKLYQLAGYMVSAVFVYLLVQKASQIDFQKIRVFLRPQDLLTLIILLFSGYAIRVLRWKILLEAAGIKISFPILYVNFIMSIGINNVLPFRAGDAYRVVGIKGNVTKTQLFASVVMERIMDLLTLLVMFGIWLSNENIEWENNIFKSFIMILVILLGIILFTYFLVKRYGKNRGVAGTGADLWCSLEVFLSNLVIQLKNFLDIKILSRTIPLSVIGWIPEVLVFLFVAHGLGINCSFSMAALTHAFATLSTLVPSSPGFFGTYHYAAYYILSAYSIDQALILLFAVIVHSILWLPPIVITVLLSVGKFYRHKFKAELPGE